jgi:hypothetical protein
VVIKKQGLPPSIGRISDLEYGRSYGAERNVVFNINQIGGVGRGKSTFQSNADGTPSLDFLLVHSLHHT